MIKETSIDRRCRKGIKRDGLSGKSAIITVLEFMSDSIDGLDNSIIDLRQELGQKIETGSPKIRDPFEEKDLYKTQQDSTKEIRWNIVSHYLEHLPVRKWKDVKCEVVRATENWYKLSRKARQREIFDVEKWCV